MAKRTHGDCTTEMNNAFDQAFEAIEKAAADHSIAKRPKKVMTKIEDNLGQPIKKQKKLHSSS